MRKFKALLLGLTMVSAVAMFAACGKDVKEPTEEDIIDALVDEDLITKDQAKGDYEFKIKEVEFNDDKDKVTVECTLGVENGYVLETTEYTVKFRLRDDGESWRARSASAGDKETKLVKGIEDDDIKDLIWYDSFTAGDEYIYFSDDETTYEVKKHALNEKENIDVVTIEGTSEAGFKSIKFTVEYTFKYETSWNEWDDQDYKVVDEKVEYVDGYEMTLTKEDIAQAYVDESEYVYVMGYYYDLYEDNGSSITDAVVNEINYSDTYAYVSADVTFTEDDVTATVNVELTYWFDTDDKQWYIQWIDMNKVVSYTCNAVGTWNGSNEDGTTYVLTIKDTLYVVDDETYNYLAAEVSATSPEGVTYSYYAYIDEYEPGNMYMSVEVGNWIVEPTDTSIWAEDFSGYYTEEGVFEGAYSWDDWTFTKSN